MINKKQNQNLYNNSPIASNNKEGHNQSSRCNGRSAESIHNMKITENNNTESAKLKELLQKHFPQTIKDNNVDLKEIANILGLNESDRNKQGYELTFTGKGIANAMYSKDTNKELKFIESKSLDSDNTNNIIIIGDNLDALKILKRAYYEKVKMIYIDPPYNTRSENFIYPDNFRADYKEILKEVGLITINENGEEIESNEMRFFKNITASKSHSGWLAFMLPRLKLAKDLLRDDGAIFISIDDNEQANLKLLCDEVFGEENFVGDCFVLDNLKGKANDNLIASVGSKLLIYAKDIDNLMSIGFNNIENIFGDKIEQKYNKGDSLSAYSLITFKKTGQGKFREDRPLMFYPILEKNEILYSITQDEFELIFDRNTKIFNDAFLEKLRKKYASYNFILPIDSNGRYLRWTSGFNTFRKKINTDIIYSNGVQQKVRPQAGEELQIYASATPKTLMYKPTYSMGTADLKSLFNLELFDFPKPVSLLKDILKLVTNSSGNSYRSAPLPIMSNNKESHNQYSHCKTLSVKALHNMKSKENNNMQSYKNININKDISLKAQYGNISKYTSPTTQHNNTPDIILDFFAGSGTIAQAVMELNNEDNANRQFILVQLNEEIIESKNKIAYSFCKNELDSNNPTISDITIERAKRASQRIKKNNELNKIDNKVNNADTIDLGFKVFTLENKTEIINTKDNLLKLTTSNNLSYYDIALNLVLKSSKTLDKKIETIIKDSLYKCEDSYYLIERSKEAIEILKTTKNEYIFINGYANIDLQDLLNIEAFARGRVRVVC